MNVTATLRPSLPTLSQLGVTQQQILGGGQMPRLAGCLMPLVSNTKVNHCLLSMSATRVTILWLKQPISFTVCMGS